MHRSLVALTLVHRIITSVASISKLLITFPVETCIPHCPEINTEQV